MYIIILAIGVFAVAVACVMCFAAVTSLRACIVSIFALLALLFAISFLRFGYNTARGCDRQSIATKRPYLDKGT